MTPMIDVVFLLLVFFICASVGGTADHLLPAELNGTTASSQAERPAEQAADWEHPAIQIRMEPGPTGPKILLDNQLLPDSEALTERLTLLAAADAESKIILNIQDEIQVQQFIHVYDLCQSLKFQNISFAVAARDEPK
jgi:biopolymer transport protein ExbD